MTGTHVAQFEILEKLGQGGMGVVYKALDTKLNRTVALKFLPVEMSGDATAKARFIQEAQAASSLDHANICTIFEVGETEDGKLFIAMAYYEGETLKYLLDGSRQSVERIQSVGAQLARALSRAHRAGMTHRDVKPANIMLTRDNEVKLLDFGLAKLADGNDLTVMGSTVGTAAYMSPEQMRGDEVTAAADVWSMGAVLYELATGQKPFVVDYDQALMYAILNEDPAPVSSLNSELPEPVAKAIDACLSKKVESRPAIESLKSVFTDDSSGSRSVVSQSTGQPPSAGSTSAVKATNFQLTRTHMLGGVVVLLLIVVAFVATRPGDSNEASVGRSSAALTAQAVDSRSIAVLPFTYRGGEADDAAVFAGGMHDDVLAKLAGIGGLTVISRTSVMQYVDTTKPLSEIASELGVQNILEGSIQKAGNRVRVTTSLIDASSGVQLWSESYDEELTVENIFAIQSDLSQQIAIALETELTAEDRARLEDAADISEEAYDLFTRGVYKMRNSNSTEELRESAEMLKRVTEIAPSFAKAFAELSFVYQRGIGRGVWTHNERGRDAKTAAERAMELDPRMPEALIAASGIADDELRFSDAEALLVRALEISPGEAQVYSLYANLLYKTGRPADALESARRAVALDPLDIRQRQRLADVYFFIGMYEETIVESRKILEMKSDDAWSYYNIGYGMALLGRVTEAVAAFQKAVDIDGEDSVLIMGLAWAHAKAGNNLESVSIMIDVPDTDSNLKEKAIVYGVMGDLDTAFQMLNRAYDMNPGAVAIIAGDDSVPLEMREDPRFKEILDKLGLEAS